jgi:hypothetical protein
MCRWLAYSGSPIPMEELLHKPRFSLIDQNLHSRLEPAGFRPIATVTSHLTTRS